MRVAALEVDLRTGDVAGNLAAVQDGITAAAGLGAVLVAVPEMWPTSFVAGADSGTFASSDAAVAEVARLASELGLTVVGSAFGSPSAGELPTNRAHVLGPDGAPDGGVPYYDKVHLFSPTAEHLAFAAGDEPPPVLQLSGTDVQLAPVICYDLRFPEVARAAFRAGAELLVAVAQWPETRAPHWRAILRGRAAELEGFVLASNRIGVDEIGRRRMRLEFRGHSCCIAPSGQDLPIADETVLGCGRGRAIAFDVDIEEARALRRAVPVLRDERRELFSGWMTGE